MQQLEHLYRQQLERQQLEQQLSRQLPWQPDGQLWQRQQLAHLLGQQLHWGRTGDQRTGLKMQQHKWREPSAKISIRKGFIWSLASLGAFKKNAIFINLTYQKLHLCMSLFECARAQTDEKQLCFIIFYSSRVTSDQVTSVIQCTTFYPGLMSDIYQPVHCPCQSVACASTGINLILPPNKQLLYTNLWQILSKSS